MVNFLGHGQKLRLQVVKRSASYSSCALVGNAIFCVARDSSLALNPPVLWGGIPAKAFYSQAIGYSVSGSILLKFVGSIRSVSSIVELFFAEFLASHSQARFPQLYLVAKQT